MINSNELYRLIGKNLSNLRREYSIGTQQKLAEDTGLSRSFISQIEGPNVDKGFSIDTLFLISQTYKIDIRRFFDNYETLFEQEENSK